MLDVVNEIEIHLITSGKNTKGWVHTHGMHRHGKPELEIKGIPIFMGSQACTLLNKLASYMLNSGVTFKIGETVQLSPNCIVRLVKGTPPNPDDADEIATHYTVERWELVDVNMPCEACSSETPSAKA